LGQTVIAPGDRGVDRSAAVERWVQVLIMLAIGGAAGAGSFRHVHDVAASHGQAGWLAWADAVVLELMSVASGLELRHRKRAHESTRFPAIVMAVSVVLSLSAQVVEAERSVMGWVAAAIPALGFLVMVKLALTRSGQIHGGTVEMEEGEHLPINDHGEWDVTEHEEGGDGESEAGEVDPAVGCSSRPLGLRRRRCIGRSVVSPGRL
jgi:hypothetical protein